MPMQPPPPSTTMAQPPNSMVQSAGGPPMSYGMTGPAPTQSTTEDATAVTSTYNMAPMGAALPHPGK